MFFLKILIFLKQNNTLNIQQYNYSEHPYLLPQFMDIFTWSMPFVVEKVSDMFINILKGGNNENISDDEEEGVPHITPPIKDDHYKALTSEKGNKLRNKIKFIGKIAKLQKTLRFLKKNKSYSSNFFLFLNISLKK